MDRNVNGTKILAGGGELILPITAVNVRISIPWLILKRVQTLCKSVVNVKVDSDTSLPLSNGDTSIISRAWDQSFHNLVLSEIAVEPSQLLPSLS